MADSNSLSRRWLRAIANNPIVAVLIVIGTIVLGVLKWANDTTKQATELHQRFTDGSAKQTVRSAYELGKTVSWISYVETVRNGSSLDPETDQAMRNKRAELGSYLGSLGIT